MAILTRPLTLSPCQQYFLRVPHATTSEPSFLPVRFISYQPCPALVFVSLLQSASAAVCVARDDLFIEAVG
jgi:hypothetical protein